MAKPENLTIVVPLFNEADSVEHLVGAVGEVLEGLFASGEVGTADLVLVDDGSTDGTGELADRLASDFAWVRVAHHDRNRGLGAAVRTGLERSTGELVLYTDADLPCDLAELGRALRLLRIYQADIVSAYRHDRTAEGPRRLVYSYAYNHIVRAAFGIRLRDVNFAFKLIRREVLDQLVLRSEGSFIDAEMLVRADRLGFRTVQFGVDYFPRSRGVSTLSSAATIRRIVSEMAKLRREVSSPPPQRSAGQLLIVNADDYGLTTGVSEGILRAAETGIVTSTSALTVAPAFAATGGWLAATSMGVGVHLALVGEDPPLLGAREVPSLVDRRGRFPLTWKDFLARACRGRVDPEDVRRELTAQIDAVAALGVPLTHLDAHQHLHLWPSVREVVLDLAAERDIKAIRVPRSSAGGPRGRALNWLAGGLMSRANEAGVAFPQASAGFDQSGSLDSHRLAEALDTLVATSAPTLELFAHPGEADDPSRSRYAWGYRWGDELEALCGPSARDAVASRQLTLGTYADLVAR